MRTRRTSTCGGSVVFSALLASLLFFFSPSCVVDARPGTTLEGAMVRAYNEMVYDGKWDEVFGQIGLLSQDMCPGTPAVWPWPYPVEGTDLADALARNTLRCAYPAGPPLVTPHGNVVLNTTLDGSRRPSGAVVVWFDLLAQAVQAQYNVPFTVVWNITGNTAADALDSVIGGFSDAACGSFLPSRPYGSVAPTSVLSFMACPTYYAVPTVWVRKDATVDNWNELVGKVVTEGWVICVASPAESFQETACTSVLGQYTIPVKGSSCAGYTDAFDRMLNKDGCNAVYGLTTPTNNQRQNLDHFGGPVANVWGSYFRPRDLKKPVPTKLYFTLSVNP